MILITSWYNPQYALEGILLTLLDQVISWIKTRPQIMSGNVIGNFPWKTYDLIVYISLDNCICAFPVKSGFFFFIK